jgi:hypothetical protein
LRSISEDEGGASGYLISGQGMKAWVSVVDDGYSGHVMDDSLDGFGWRSHV